MRADKPWPCDSRLRSSSILTVLTGVACSTGSRDSFEARPLVGLPRGAWPAGRPVGLAKELER